MCSGTGWCSVSFYQLHGICPGHSRRTFQLTMEPHDHNHTDHPWVKSEPCEGCGAYKRMCGVDGCSVQQIVDANGVIIKAYDRRAESRMGD